jgi:hypothetical protein
MPVYLCNGTDAAIRIITVRTISLTSKFTTPNPTIADKTGSPPNSPCRRHRPHFRSTGWMRDMPL